MKLINIILDAHKGFEGIEDFAISIFDFPDDCISFFKALNFQSKKDVIMSIDKIFLKYKNLHNGRHEIEIQQHFDKLCK